MKRNEGEYIRQDSASENNNNIESGYGDELEKIENLNTFGYSADGFMEISDEGVKDIYLKYKEYGLVRSDQDGS